MSAKNIKTQLAIVVVVFAILACNLPGGTAPTAEATSTPTFTPIPSETPSPIATVEACVPTITTLADANVRNGPGQVYGVIGLIPLGGKANVAGKNYDNTWWYIQFAGGNGGYAWISATVTSATCIPDTLASIAAPPTPIAPTPVPSVVAASTFPIITFDFNFPIFKLPSPTPTLIFIPLPILPPFSP